MTVFVVRNIRAKYINKRRVLKAQFSKGKIN
jgi:hypothetical protein